MAKENDSKIKTLLTAIENKKKAMGTKPKAIWKTNALIGDGKVNINTINSTEVCIKLAAQAIQEKRAFSEACEFLGVSESESSGISNLEDTLDDLKLKVSMIEWDKEKKKLTAMEAKLKDLRSEDLKTEDALADITSSLGL